MLSYVTFHLLSFQMFKKFDSTKKQNVYMSSDFSLQAAVRTYFVGPYVTAVAF